MGVRWDMPAVIQIYSARGLWKREAASTGLSPTNTAGIIASMSEVVPITAWMTYQQVAERLGLRSASAAASRARRGKWPRWTRNDTLETEVCVPPEVLVAGLQKPRERQEAAGPTGRSCISK